MKVLTEKGGDYQISDELRDMLALLDDGRLFVAKSYISNPHVRAFISRLQHNGVQYTLNYTDLSGVANWYRRSTVQDAHSDMQRAAKELFEQAVSLRASDIHIRVSKRARTQILFRIHNDLRFMVEYPFDYGDQLCTTIYQAMADVSDSTFEQLSRQDARISEKSKIPEKIDGIRIATSPQVDGYIMVLRLLYNDASDDLRLLTLGYSQKQVDAIEYMKKRPTGVIIIGGPTGSGKSTTLQRTLSSIIRETGGRKHIITVEDPPEYPISGAVQTPVTNADSEEARSREYQKAIKATMRLDPDIIMLSEVRDNPTARLVIQAAMTGHQVWTTVHANSALAIITRMVDLGVPLELLSDPTVIAGLICQRLVKQLCPHCKKSLSEHLHEFEEKDIKRFIRVLNMRHIFIQGPGCDQCSGSGIFGRTVVAETIVTDDQLMAYIKSGDRLGALAYVHNEQAGMTMLEHSILKINEGIVDPFQAEEIVGALGAMIDRDPLVIAEALAA